MDLPKLIRYYEATDMPDKEKEEIRRYLSKLSPEIEVRSKRTFQIPAIHYIQDEKMEVVEGRGQIISKLAEFLQN